MKRNPNPKIRIPKEARNPKPECDSARSAVDLEPAFLAWDQPSHEGLELHENAPTDDPQPRDLAERTARFGERVVQFAKRIPQNPVNSRLITQLVGAGTSIGANYCEADDSVSGKEFKLKIGTCRKESKETMFFLRMIATAEPRLAIEARQLWREAKELNLIFGAIWRK
jgi:four helix bundle protein